MATTLHWKAYELKDKLFDQKLSSHKILMDVTNEKFVVHQNSKHLFNFYLELVNIFLHSLFCLYIISKFVFTPNIVPVFMVLLYVQLTGTFFLSTGLNYLAIRHGENLFEEYCNTLFRFDRLLKGDKRKVGYAVEILFWQSIRRGKIYTFLIYN